MGSAADQVSVAYNQQAIARLAAAIARGSAAVLVGAGISRRLGYPDWEGLLDGMREAIHERWPADAPSPALPKAGDPLWRAEKYRGLLGDAYGEFIRRRFEAMDDGRLSADACLQHLCAIPFAFYLTTNYDRSLERACDLLQRRTLDSFHFEDEAKVTRFLLGLHGGARQDVCVHVHGLHDDVRGLVLTESDYQRRYLQTDEHRFKLLLLFASHSIVFVGFSLADLDLLSVPREMKAKLRFEDTRHFAVLPFEAEQEEDLAGYRDSLASKYAIEPILFKVPKDKDGRRDYEGLTRVLDAIRVAAAPGVAAAPPLEPPVSRGEAARVKGAGTLGAGLDQRGDVRAGVSLATQDAATRSRPSRRAAPGGARPSWEPGPVRYPDDPQKGRWGGSSERDGLRLSARVRERAEMPGWFEIETRVDAPRGLSAEGEVTFHLHDSFEPSSMTRPLTPGGATLNVVAWGAFTMGALARIGGRQVPLELDLAALEDAPRRFREAG